MDLAAILGFHSMMNQDQYHENESGKWAQKAEQIGILIKKITSNNISYSWVPNRRVYSFIWHQRNMKKKTDTKTDKSI